MKESCKYQPHFSFNADGKTRIKKKVIPLLELKTVKQHSLFQCL